MLSCLVHPTGGDALLLGDSIIKSPDAVKQKINVSPQETAVASNLTIKENLELIARIYGKAKTLSGGMQQRLSIAMAGGVFFMLEC